MKFLAGLLKDWGIAFIVVLAAFAVFSWVTTPVPKTEGPAPPFTLNDLDGNPVSLAELDAAGEVVVLNFWFTTCPPCRREIPELSAFHEENPDIPLVGISIDRNMPAPRLAATSERLGVTYPVLQDPEARVAASYGVGVYPTTILVRDGQIVASRVGEVTRSSLAQMIDAAKP